MGTHWIKAPNFYMRILIPLGVTFLLGPNW